MTTPVDDNPFVSPNAEIVAEPEVSTAQPADFGRRVGAYVIDLALASTVAIGLMALGLAIPSAVLLSFALALPGLYRTGFDAFGGTVGKRLLGMRVVTGAGENLGVMTSAIRNIDGLILSAIAAKTGLVLIVDHAFIATSATGLLVLRLAVVLLLAYAAASGLASAFDRRGRAWHDRLAGSRCVVGDFSARASRHGRPAPRRSADRRRAR